MAFWLTLVSFVIASFVLIVLVLLQKGRGGVASVLGGSGGNTVFGPKTGDVLTWATSIAFGFFLLLAVALNLLANARQGP